jgi:hypothetical protein
MRQELQVSLPGMLLNLPATQATRKRRAMKKQLSWWGGRRETARGRDVSTAAWAAVLSVGHA